MERLKCLFCDNVKFFCFSSNYDTPPTVDLSDLKVETERRVDKGQPSHILQNKFKSALSTLPYSDPSTPEAAGTYRLDTWRAVRRIRIRIKIKWILSTVGEFIFHFPSRNVENILISSYVASYRSESNSLHVLHHGGGGENIIWVIYSILNLCAVHSLVYTVYATVYTV